MPSIPGVPYPVYIAGSRTTRMYPFGPLPGCAARITFLSYDGDVLRRPEYRHAGDHRPRRARQRPAGRPRRGGGASGLSVTTVLVVVAGAGVGGLGPVERMAPSLTSRPNQNCAPGVSARIVSRKPMMTSTNCQPELPLGLRMPRCCHQLQTRPSRGRRRP